MSAVQDIELSKATVAVIVPLVTPEVSSQAVNLKPSTVPIALSEKLKLISSSFNATLLRPYVAFISKFTVLL